MEHGRQLLPGGASMCELGTCFEAERAAKAISAAQAVPLSHESVSGFLKRALWLVFQQCNELSSPLRWCQPCCRAVCRCHVIGVRCWERCGEMIGRKTAASRNDGTQYTVITATCCFCGWMPPTLVPQECLKIRVILFSLCQLVGGHLCRMPAYW
ncbi:hypothetical protein CEXT_108751 [Caerostris extrusa]|uniref:Uncharacterized protein n=1 Tax=Caerostris extrusa TaxID=172846 RepID=A0AAV4P938_CAEEX|nr:hypothetical protein CEXT_108751 [Caerostris extrusa]